jgi:hypothetical protein
MSIMHFIQLAEDLELAGLIWSPEIGDEIARRDDREHVSILVDSQGMSPLQLRSYFMWLPSVEQIILQFEARQAILFHAGLDLSETSMCYKTVIQSKEGPIETCASSLRNSLGIALRSLLLSASTDELH